MRKLGLIFLLSSLAASAADVYTFGLLPPGGFVQGSAASTVGWGYTLQNQSTSLWLVPVNLNAGTFTNGTPELLFDFPALAPDTSLAQSFDPATSTGLYQLTWDPSATAGSSNTGTFTLDAEWWNGDPLAGGVFVSGAPSSTTRYTATVSPAAVPEPRTIALMALAGLVLLLPSAPCAIASIRSQRNHGIDA